MARSVAWPGRLALVALATAGCAHLPSMQTVESVDLSRFAGEWYVVAHIPESRERDACGAVQTYQLDMDGTIAITYTFRECSLEGERKVYTARAFVRNRDTNASWSVQYHWPFRSEYLVVHLDEHYTEAIIGRSARDRVWVLSRTPAIPDERYQALVERVKELGYDVTELRRVPQG